MIVWTQAGNWKKVELKSKYIFFLVKNSISGALMLHVIKKKGYKTDLVCIAI